jgi:hypothetical protein
MFFLCVGLWRSTTIDKEFQIKFDLSSIKLFVQSGVQLKILMSIWLKSMKIQLEFDWIKIEIQLIGIAFN